MDFELIKDGDGVGFFREARARSQEMAERDPDVGDVVHYWDDDAAKCRAATVTGFLFASASEQAECLFVMDPDEQEIRWKQAIPHSEQKKRLTWHWPCGGQ